MPFPRELAWIEIQTAQKGEPRSNGNNRKTPHSPSSQTGVSLLVAVLCHIQKGFYSSVREAVALFVRRSLSKEKSQGFLQWILIQP